MYEGGWNEVFFFDAAILPDQRAALDIILTGKAGGPWQVLSRFVSNHLKSRVACLHFEDQGREKRMWIDGVFETEISAIRAKDDRGEALGVFVSISCRRTVAHSIFPLDKNAESPKYSTVSSVWMAYFEYCLNYQ
jgi:hypothetical protein